MAFQAALSSARLKIEAKLEGTVWDRQYLGFSSIGMMVKIVQLDDLARVQGRD